MDNPSLDQALNTAWDNTQDDSSDVVEETQSQVVAKDEVTTPEVGSEETPQSNGDSEPEDKFSSLNPEELPDEVKPIYKSLQADYTRKRQADSAKVKELEARLDQLLNAQEPGEEEDLSNLTPEQIKEIAKQEVLNETVKVWEATAKQELDEIDPRLNENHPEYEKTAWFDQLIRARLDQELEMYKEENGTPVGFDYKGVAKKLISSLDEYVEEKSKTYLQKQSQLAKSKAEKLQKANPTVTNPETKRSGRMSIDDAIEMAFERS